MTIVDTITPVVHALVAILNADADLRTLFGRTAGLVVPWETLSPSTGLPVLTYALIATAPASFGVDQLQVQVTCFAASRATATLAITRVVQALTSPAFAAQSVEVAINPDALPVRSWPDADPLLFDTADARADVTLSFLIAA